ncbi:quinate permease [Trichosporon asahii var. asahii CBS 2479]|uniref:Quinate permease n=1 Tax=Trichosporon asahii var. asahii (strain ATCC 90039 / CBS 2479 / JCM 2466 / KCTC 7840 / NBRC 103889/ NCYC 2677 / UAMH 7654) TaxID=1186058 RepID=J4UFG6_TRIAS|nr:quinate permease [Trichosporon asahii var. asahii CBS 2479]EJT50110.1 quinate permease [Trichosporon asahii var. asahii CBS 2479]
MAGGVKKPINIFRLGDLGEPKGVFNWRLWFSVISFGLLGAARGIDEGLIGGAFRSKNFQDLIHFKDYSEVEQANIKGNVTSMVLIGSVAASAFVVCDRIGRLWATRQLCIWWAVGITIFLCNRGHLGAVYAGRFIANLAYWSNYGTERHMGSNVKERWMVPSSIHIMFAGLIFILSWFQYESPRYLIKRGRVDDARHVMSRLRRLPEDDPYVCNEIAAIQHAHDSEVEATRGMTFWQTVKETFTSKGNLYRLYLTTSVQFLSQWSGAGSITIYAPDFFEILGVKGSEQGLLVTAVFGLVKLGAALICALFLVDVIGRKRSLLLGISLQTISMVYVAAFLSTHPKLGMDDHYHLPTNSLPASRGAIAMIYLSGFGWALGWNSMQYLLTAELFPLRIRAIGTSWAMALHFANQYGNARAVPNLLLPTSQGGITAQGTFWSFACVTIIGGAWVWFFVPETAGRSLEEMSRLFELPWYKIGRYGNKFAEQRDAEERREDFEEDKIEDVQNEYDEEKRRKEAPLV